MSTNCARDRPPQDGPRLPSAGALGWYNRRVCVAAALQGIGDKAARLHLLDEFAQIAGTRLAAFRRSHRLADFHEAAADEPHVGMTRRVGDKTTQPHHFSLPWSATLVDDEHLVRAKTVRQQFGACRRHQDHVLDMPVAYMRFEGEDHALL